MSLTVTLITYHSHYLKSIKVGDIAIYIGGLNVWGILLSDVDCG